MNLKTLYITPSLTKVLGFTPAERSRQRLDERMTPDSVSRVREALARLLALEKKGKRIAEKPLTLLLEYYHRDGSTRWLETVVQGFHNTRGDLTVIHGVSRDVTRRKQAQDELQRERIFLRSVIDGLPGVFYIADESDGLLFWNGNFEKTTGFSEEEIRKMPVMGHIAEPDRRNLSNKIKQTALQGEISVEAGLVCKDGTVRDYLFQANRIEYQGRTCRMVAGTDITEHKQTQSALRSFAEELEDANKALRVLLRGRNEGQKAIEEKLQANINDLVMPYLEKIGRAMREDPCKQYLNVLAGNLKEIVSPFMKNVQSLQKYLTPQEIQVADLIRKGMRTKEIAGVLNTSDSTIGTHRNNIRKKLNLTRQGVNLRSYLQSLQ